ncbi:cytochrome P450 [Streptomyces chumphonensis]|uniref:Cytochrome P450 n=1 Tax=Streptomyces chumphonensis TaxID=1214925 RepID=A0A927EXU2_9ACTN|nr:cytochrome P450 [Streptomyces chumphonensis]MBD3930649.1 cytochrome P450 [Streptomyces chumphonensis]
MTEVHNAPHRLDPAGGCPHAANARFLAEGAVTRVVLPDDVEGAIVLGHQELKEFLSHPDVAKNARHFTALENGEIPDGWPLRTFATVQSMTTADGADHRRLRSLVSRAFTARRVEALRPRVEELAARLLDDLERAAAQSEDGTADLRRNFAMPLPMGVICELLGVDAEQGEQLHALSNRVVSTSLKPADVVAANQELLQVLAQVAAARAADPGDDLTSALIAAREEDGDRLSEPELIGTLMLMVIAGHETTLNLITNAVRALSGHPEQLDAVRSGTADWGDVVEETMRWDSPVSYFPFRYPTRDLTLDGTVIPAGTPVLAGYSGAGRDPRTHGADADVFDVTRTQVRHLSFGHGAHFCIGAPLARMEASLALEALFTRFPQLTVAVDETEIPRRGSFVGNSVPVLPVRLTAAP